MSQSSPDGRTPVDREVLSRCSLLIVEASPWKKYHALTDAEQLHLPASCRTVRVPTIHFNSLWPLMTTDPRNVPDPPRAPWGLFPFAIADRLALNIIRAIENPGDRLASYLAVDINFVVNIGRNHEIEASDMISRERDCDIQVADYVIANFRRRRLFYMFHHPTEEFMTFIVMQLLSLAAVGATVGGAGQADPSVVQRWMSRKRPFYGQAPIHPAVAEHFELEWYDPDTKYQWLGGPYTFNEWTEFYLNYDEKAAVRR